MKADPRSTLAFGNFFCGGFFYCFRRAICQILERKWALQIGKLPSGGLPKNSVVKLLLLTQPQLFMMDAEQQSKQKWKHSIEHFFPFSTNLRRGLF